jgi:hypothetical protein
MKLTRVLFAVLAVAALGTLVGCDLLNGRDTSSIIGSIDIALGSVIGGAKYQVVLYSRETTMNPTTDFPYAPQVAAVTGNFPGAGLDVSYTTVNFEMDEVPAGEYALFVWADADDDGVFNSNYDAYGFYSGADGWTTLKPDPNVVVREVGIVDADLTISNPGWAAV